MEERFAAHEEDEPHAQEAEKQQVCACQIDVSLYACMHLIHNQELLSCMLVDSCMCVCVYVCLFMCVQESLEPQESVTWTEDDADKQQVCACQIDVFIICLHASHT